MKMESSSIARRDDYILLTAGMLRLLLPLEEVGEVEYLDGKLCSSEVPGVLKLCDSDSAHRFIALSEKMEMLPECPRRRFIAASIGRKDDLLWCWDELQVLLDSNLNLEPLPSVLLVSKAPFDHFVKLDSGLAYVCDAQELRSVVFGDQEYKNGDGYQIDN